MGYVDFGSSCTIITKNESVRLNLIINFNEKCILRGYGDGKVTSEGSTSFELKVDEVSEEIKAVVVADSVQQVPVLIGRNFTELPNVLVIKDASKLQFLNKNNKPENRYEAKTKSKKIVLKAKTNQIIPSNTLTNIEIICPDYLGDAFIDVHLRTHEGQEAIIPRTVIRLEQDKVTYVPFVNLSENTIRIKKGDTIVRAFPCYEETIVEESVSKIDDEKMRKLEVKDVRMGQIEEHEKKKLLELLNEFGDCFAEDTSQLGCARSVEMDICLQDDKPFSYHPYRMARTEQEAVSDIITDLLQNNIIRPSNSNYSSPILLVKKKNGEQRLCIDYRRLNSITIKDNHPLPRIDDQVDRLQGGVYFTSLDLRSGYYQIPLKETAKKYTSFVTTSGQYEYNRMPFGLTNAPRVFQRLMNRILLPLKDIASVYLDDVLLHAKTVEEALNGLRKALLIFREEGLKLNMKKCSFLVTSVSFLGYEIGNGTVRPGAEKTESIRQFSPPKNVRQVRQFLGLTGYFRQFVKNYALIAKPITMLLRKDTKWKWESKHQTAFEELKEILCKRPVLALFDPRATTEIHTDASSIGVAGIMLQRLSDDKLHPVAYFSRQTNEAEQKCHSYELETLAVVETLKKFRTYLLGMPFTVVTDCNALKATAKKKYVIPRIARWWLQLQEFTFDVTYRPGTRLKHVDALSRNPPDITQQSKNNEVEFVLRVQQADWILSSQLMDEKLKEIQRVLSKAPTNEHEKQVYKNYALRDGRIYRITARGLLWVIPKGMRHEIVRISHDDFGHFAAEKTLKRICQHYWFPRMRQYVEKYISCCIACLISKRNSGKKEGHLHPIDKVAQPIRTIHVDHLGPFTKSKKGNEYLIVGVDAFTKFIFLKAVKSTKTKYVIDYFKDIFATYGSPRILISDQGSSFTAKKFKEFCVQNNIQHVLTAVATPRANGQVERLNKTVLNILLATTLEEERWDENVRAAQFSINNTVNKSTGRTPSKLLFGFEPRGGADILLREEVSKASTIIDDLMDERQRAYDQIVKAQEEQKRNFDKKRKKPRCYAEGDLVVIEKQEASTSKSKKLIPPYAGPMVVKAVLPNDRYLVEDMKGSHRTARKTRYRKVVAVDKMKPWRLPGGVSEETEDESGEDGVVLTSDDDSQVDEAAPRDAV